MEQQSMRMGAIEVRPVDRELRVDGAPVAIGARAFDVLVALMERRNRVVTKNELLDLVWPDVVVEENSLQSQVSQLRRILGPKAIATIPGRGYQFVVPAGKEKEAAPAARPFAPVAAPPDAEEQLLGRDVDLDVLMTLLDQHRLVTIAGGGGIGKTTLAQAVARRRAGRHPDGVSFVDLAAISAPDRIATAIANAADLLLGDGQPEAVLPRALAGRDLMLVLDNCEHLVKAVALLVDAMLKSAPTVRILATSQEVLQVPGEHVYRLETLAVPPVGTPLSMANRYSALQLLELRAKAADGRFALNAEMLPGAIELCRRLDGIPLAIEMAAARLPLLGPDALVTRLDERMRLLRSPLRNAPTRHQTLQATLDWSHSLLNAAEQAAFRRFSIFAGSFRLEAAQQVAGWGELDEWSALDALMGLVDKSLVQVEAGEVPRYRLLETSRIYAAEQMLKHGEVDATRNRHGAAMKRLADGARRAYWLMEERPSLEQLYPDYDDLQAAFEHACERKDADVAGSTGLMLCAVDFERNVYANVRARKEAAYRMLEHSKPVARAMLLHILSHFHALLLPQLPRLALEEERVALYRQFGKLGTSPDGFAKANRQLYFSLARLSADYAISRRFEESKAALAEALSLEDPRWTPHFRWFLAFGAKKAAIYWDDPTEVVRWSRVMLDLARQAKWPHRIAESMNACAEGAFMAGRFDEAMKIAAESADELRRLNQPINFFEALTLLAAARLRLGDAAGARAAALEAFALPWQLELSTPCFDLAALLASHAGRHADAAMLFGVADRGYAISQDRRHSIGAWAEAEGASLIVAALGAGEHARLRKSGAALTDAQAEALAIKPGSDHLSRATEQVV